MSGRFSPDGRTSGEGVVATVGVLHLDDASPHPAVGRAVTALSAGPAAQGCDPAAPTSDRTRLDKGPGGRSGGAHMRLIRAESLWPRRPETSECDHARTSEKEINHGGYSVVAIRWLVSDRRDAALPRT